MLKFIAFALVELDLHNKCTTDEETAHYIEYMLKGNNIDYTKVQLSNGDYRFTINE